MVLFVPGFVHDLHILSHVLQCRIIHILMTTVPQFKAPVYYVLKSLFLVHDGDVWGLWIRDTLKTPILIMHMNKNIICHLLCRSMKKLYQVLYTCIFFFFFWVIKRKKIYLYYTACEQKRALWVADAHFPPLSSLSVCGCLSFCLCISSLSVLSHCTHVLCSTMFLVTVRHYLYSKIIINMYLCWNGGDPVWGRTQNTCCNTGGDWKWLIVDSVMLFDIMVSTYSFIE